MGMQRAMDMSNLLQGSRIRTILQEPKKDSGTWKVQMSKDLKYNVLVSYMHAPADLTQNGRIIQEGFAQSAAPEMIKWTPRFVESVVVKACLLESELAWGPNTTTVCSQPARISQSVP